MIDGLIEHLEEYLQVSCEDDFKGVPGYPGRSFLEVHIKIDMNNKNLHDSVFTQNSGIMLFPSQSMKLKEYSHLLYTPPQIDAANSYPIPIGEWCIIPSVATFAQLNNFGFGIYYNKNTQQFERLTSTTDDSELISYEVKYDKEKEEYDNWPYEIEVTWNMPIFTLFTLNLNLPDGPSPGYVQAVTPKWYTDKIEGYLGIWMYVGNVSYYDYLRYEDFYSMKGTTDIFNNIYPEKPMPSLFDNKVIKIIDFTGVASEKAWARSKLRVTATTDKEGYPFLFFNLPAASYDFHGQRIFLPGKGGPLSGTISPNNTVPATGAYAKYPFVYSSNNGILYMGYLNQIGSARWKQLFLEDFAATKCKSEGDAIRCLDNFYDAVDISQNFKWVNKWYYDDGDEDYVEFGTGARSVPIVSLRINNNNIILGLTVGYGSTWL